MFTAFPPPPPCHRDPSANRAVHRGREQAAETEREGLPGCFRDRQRGPSLFGECAHCRHFLDVTCQIVSSDWKLEVYNSPACSVAVNGVLCLNRRWDPSFLDIYNETSREVLQQGELQGEVNTSFSTTGSLYKEMCPDRHFNVASGDLKFPHQVSSTVGLSVCVVCVCVCVFVLQG